MKRETSRESLCRAVLAPMRADTLRGYIEREFSGRYGEDSGWFIIEGTQNYCGIAAASAETEGAKFAAALSREADAEVYALEFDPETSDISVYRNGVRTGSIDEDPRAFAVRLGVLLPPPAAHVVETFKLAAVSGATVEEVAASLADYAAEPWLHIEQKGDMVIVRSDDGDIGLLAWDISDALPRAEVYLLMRGPQPDRFAVHLLLAGDTLGAFELPQQNTGTVKTLESIRGAQDPKEICARLGIMPSLIGLDR